MFLREEYFFFRLSYDLIKEQAFNIIHINNSLTEIWLEKKINRQSHLIRLFHHSFDWKNHLQKDIDRTIVNSKKMKRLVLGRNIQVHNIYVATHPPVGEWESIKDPIPLKDNKLSTMDVYYMDEMERESEKKRFYQQLTLTNKPVEYPSTELEMERLTHYLKAMITGIHHKSKKETENLFNNSRPLMSYLLLIANVAMFLLLEFQGGSTNQETLITYGAKYNPAIIDGEWWRIISSMFLHIGGLHLFMNMLALYFVGTIVERIYGSSRFLIIYFLAGIIGGLTSFALSPQLAAGASGALFGLFGALLFFGLNYRRVFFQTMGWNVIIVICINIVFGLSVPQIDNGAHMGGLLGGFIASSIVFFPMKKRIAVQLLSMIAYVGIVIGLIFFGITNTSVQMDETLQLQKTQELIQEEQFDKVVEVTTESIDNNPEQYLAEFLFFRSFASINLNQIDDATKDLEEVVQIKPNDFPEAHYNLALLYLEDGNIDKALEQVEKALEIEPNNTDFSSLYERLSTGE